MGTEAGGSGSAEAPLGTGRAYVILALQQLGLKPESKWKTTCPEELDCACCLKPVWWMLVLLLVLLLLADHSLGLHSWQMKKTEGVTLSDPGAPLEAQPVACSSSEEAAASPSWRHQVPYVMVTHPQPVQEAEAAADPIW